MRSATNGHSQGEVFEMEESKLRWLLARVHERSLPLAFERLWQKQHDVNPVLQALTYEQWHAKCTRGWHIGFGLALASAIVCAAWAIEINHGDPLHDMNFPLALIVLTGFSISIVGCGGGLVVGFGNVFSRRPTSEEAEAFAVDLYHFCIWYAGWVLNGSWWVAVIESFQKEEFGEEHLIKMASTILELVAEKILELQAQGELDTVFLDQKKAWLDELRSKYDVLQRLGLASGGYEGYFAKAKESIERVAT